MENETPEDPATVDDPTYDESEVMELGLSHQVISDEVYLPSHPSRDWIRCCVTVSTSDCFRMYLEGKKRVRFLLSAKQFNESTLLISTLEDFPLLINPPINDYIARIDRQRDMSYLLALTQCHLCDFKLGLYHCGRGPREREVIAKISHFTQRFRAIGLDYGCVKVNIPAISKSGKRKIWCPRAFRKSNPNMGYDVNVDRAIKDLDRSSMFTFINQSPEWNAELESLVVRFQGSRILRPSSKNFLLCWAADGSDASMATTSSTRSVSPMNSRTDNSSHTQEQPPPPAPSFMGIATPKQRISKSVHNIDSTAVITNHESSSPRSKSKKSNKSSVGKSRKSSSSHHRVNSSSGSGEAIMQFGKCSSTRFTLDFRFPLSPLQAFGIALASFATEQFQMTETATEIAP
jgi:hypothetical protein